MFKKPKLPCLPGFNFNDDIGKTHFHRAQHFDRIHGDVYYLADKPERSSAGSRYPALYAWGEELPRVAWLELDGQRLQFKAYFEELLWEDRTARRVRYVTIGFFLEDGTLKISEPATDNSGLEQGVLVRRQRVPLADPVHYRYHDILDLNVGEQPVIYGRRYTIYDCDPFTRRFLNRMGIAVPDPFEPPKNPVDDLARPRPPAAAAANCPKKRDKLGDFLKYDGKILRFYGYWDDRDSLYGYVHDLEILFYLADGTMEIVENLPRGAGRSLLVKRVKVPRFFREMPPIGHHEELTLLNVLGESTRRSYYVADKSWSATSNSCQGALEGYYEECDLQLGGQLNAYGRLVVLTDMDEFTRQYYRVKYGLEDFTPKPRPDDDDDDEGTRKGCGQREWYIPPYNGYGTYEDSLGNCFKAVPKRPKYSTDKYYRYENQSNDNRILRFGAKMISDVAANDDRCFVISLYLFDGTIAISEVSCKKTGHTLSLFQKRMLMRLPGQDLFSSEKPRYYGAEHLYLGAVVELNSFKFFIESADEYTLDYMERHSSQFPKANATLIMNKIRDKLRPVYREFVTEHSPEPGSYVIKLGDLKAALRKYLASPPDLLTDHEIVTLARRYSYCEPRQEAACERDYVRALVHAELLRDNWSGLERLAEDLRHFDRGQSGYLGRERLYQIIRANRLPLEKELIYLMFDRLERNCAGEIDHVDLLKFLDVKLDPPTPVVPVNVKVLKCSSRSKCPKDCQIVDWIWFIRDLDLEKEQQPRSESTLMQDGACNCNDN
ncbi:hypothetical protein TKK_0003978 [Trichogramma kaykai]|uniref:EF-hand domain-containing family member C2 n=1 Tax=Trichogramma kaykai TaxID=54128 RepID=A0ABD2XNQ3_9HYME